MTVIALALLAAACAAKPAPTRSVHTIDAAGMDRTVAPGDDFFRYANGTWEKNAQIPADRGYVGAWTTLADLTEKQTRELLEGLSASNPAAGSNERKIADYYASYMDDETLDSKALAPLAENLKKIAAIHDRRALTEWACGNIRADVDPLNATNFQTDHLFGLWFSEDFSQPDRYAPYLLQGGLGMPDRDYYLEKSPAMDKIRASYRGHIAAILRLASIAGADQKADRIFALEEQIARTHATRTDSADVQKANNPWPAGAFAAKAPGIDWQACFRAAGVERAPTFTVWHPTAVTGIAALVGSAPLDTWRDYFTFHLIEHFAGVLPKPFGEERFAFYGKVLAGTPQQRERWKRGVESTNAALGDAVGKLYVARFFPPESKKRLDAMVAAIVVAFEHRVDRLTWMNPRTKEGAKAKLASLKVGIGYPDTWRDYSNLEIVRGDAFGNAWRAEQFEYDYNRAKLGKPVDRSEWAMTPQTVNALNLPIQNALNFPAAILQPPFYDADAEAAVVFGSIGTIIGHEISHSFDDQGSQFDASGMLRNWWTPEDFAHFKEASAKLVVQYNAYQPLPDLHVNGQLTLSENIADVAGLSAAYDAYHGSRSNDAPTLNGFTQDQRFFLSFGQNWRTKWREPLLRQIVMTDGHAPDEFRADTVRNVDPWYAAFDVKPGQKLLLAPANRVQVW